MSQFHSEDGQGSQEIISAQDIVFASDSEQNGTGDIVFNTGGVERARIKHDGTGSGWPNVLGGSLSLGSYGTAGAADNLTAITNAAADAKAQGKALYIPQGVWNHSDIVVFDSIRVYGDGEDSQLVATAVGGSTGNRTAVQLIGTAPSLRNVKITQPNVVARSNSDLDVGVLVGTWTPQTSAIVGRARVFGCTIDTAASCGIATRAVTECDIEGNDIRNTLADGIQVSVKRDGSNLSGYSIRVIGNSVYNPGDDMIVAVGWDSSSARLEGITITGNLCWTQNTAGRGIVAVGALYVEIGDNVVYQPYSHGILVQAGTYSGSAVFDPSHCNVHDNIVVGAGTGDGAGHGIYLGSSATYPGTDVKAIGNTVLSPAGAGIFVDSYIDQVVVNENTVSSCPAIGIHFIAGSNQQCCHNHLKGIGTTGIQFDGGCTGRIYIHGNTLEDVSTTGSSTADAIFVAVISGAYTVTITENHHEDPNAQTMRDLVRCQNVDAFLSGNTSSTSKPVVLDTNQQARLFQTKRVSEATAPPTGGTWAVGDRVFNTTPGASGVIGWTCIGAGSPGVWRSFGAVSREQLKLTARGLIAQAFEINSANGQVLTSQTTFGSLVGLFEGDSITDIVVCITTLATGSTPTLVRFGIFDSTGKCLAVTDDQSATGLLSGSTGFQPAAISGGPWVCPADGGYDVVALMNGTFGGTAPQLLRDNYTSTIPSFPYGSGQRLSAEYGTANTDLPSVGSTAPAAASVAAKLWFGLS